MQKWEVLYQKNLREQYYRHDKKYFFNLPIKIKNKDLDHLPRQSLQSINFA